MLYSEFGLKIAFNKFFQVKYFKVQELTLLIPYVKSNKIISEYVNSRPACTGV